MDSREAEAVAAALSYSMLLEVSASPKPGAVHRLSDYPDKPYEAFLLSAVLLYPIFREAALAGSGGSSGVVGKLIYRGVEAAMTTGYNTSLGQVLLLVPLAISAGRCASIGDRSESCLLGAYKRVIEGTTVEDAILFYKAVRLASPSYIRRGDAVGDAVDVWDERFEKKLEEGGWTLYRVLVASSGRDIVADEAARALPRSSAYSRRLRELIGGGLDWNVAVARVFVEMLSKEVDTLVERKHGREVALGLVREASALAPARPDREFLEKASAWDRALKERGISPGSTADILTSTIALYLLGRLFESGRVLVPPRSFNTNA